MNPKTSAQMKPRLKLLLNGDVITLPRQPDRPNSTDWHPADVIAALHKQGTSLRELAHRHGYSHFNEVLVRPWIAAEQIVARALGAAPDEIWPSRYIDFTSRARALMLTRKVDVTGLLSGKRGAV